MNTLSKLLESWFGKGIDFSLQDGDLKLRAPKNVLTAEIIEQIKRYKKEIIVYLGEQTVSLTQGSEITKIKCSETGNYALSYAQQRLWFIDCLEEHQSSQYNMPVAIKVEGDLKIDVVEEAMKRIIQRHEVLRTVIVEAEEGAVQHILSSFEFKIKVTDLTGYSELEQQHYLKQQIEDVSNAPFDLTADLMVRLQYFALGDVECHQGVLLFNMHHIASDGWSMGILVKEFVAQYEACLHSRPDPLEPLRIQYIDYANWQKQQIENNLLASQQTYWEQQLQSIPTIHSLPLDFPRPVVKSNQGSITTSVLSPGLSTALTEFANHKDVTPFMLLHSALSIVLSCYSGSKDVVIGTPVANRMKAELEPLIGLFVNSLVLVTDTKHEDFEDYLEHVKQVNLDAQANQDVPLEFLLERQGISGSAQHNPLFQILFSMNTNEIEDLALTGVRCAYFQEERTKSKFDLELSIEIKEQLLHINWLYDVTLFRAGTIERLDKHFKAVLQRIVEIPGSSLKDISVLPQHEVYHLTRELNERTADFPQDKCIHELFEDVALTYPDKIALALEASQLSYQALNDKANQVASYLREHHSIMPNTKVGLYTERSFEMVIGILGILKAGGGYVPLDPQNPCERLAYILDDAAIEVVLSQQSLVDTPALVQRTVVALDSEVFSGYSTQNLSRSKVYSPEQLAYLIYTSGSTGKPKGVITPHRAVIRLVHKPSFMDLDHTTTFLQSANVAFDAATMELWGPLLNGGKCVLYQGAVTDLPSLNSTIRKHQVTSMWLTAGLFSQWSEGCDGLPSLKWVLAGGDVVRAADVRRVQQALPLACVINGYGPTENTTFSCCYPVGVLDKQAISVPIGKVINGDEAYVLDGLQLVPYGAIGELCVGGAGLAKGYLNQDALTAEQFIDNPYYDRQRKGSSRYLYRTGDLVRYVEGGNLEFIGRLDGQVKIRGFRVELGEIELQILKSSYVGVCAVTLNSAGTKKLAAYLVADKRSALEDSAIIEKLRADLQATLPDYMLPSAYIVLDELPLTKNGKVDRKVLPAIENNITCQNYEAPLSEYELKLTQIWSALLDLEPNTISMTASFFELGGDSILSIQAVSRAAQVGLHFSVKDIFVAKSIRELCKILTTESAVIASQAAVTGNMPLLPIQRHFFEDRTDLHHFNQSVLLQVPIDLQADFLVSVIEALIKRHDALRLKFYEEGGQWQGEHVPFQHSMLDNALIIKPWHEPNFDGLEEYLSEIQRSLDPLQGVLIKLVYVQPIKSTGCSGRLFLVLHHLVVDGVSWRIILHDLMSLYRQYQDGTPLTLAKKSSSFQQWGHFLTEFANSECLHSEKPLWLDRAKMKVSEIVSRSQTHHEERAAPEVGVAQLRLSEIQTEALLKNCNQAYRTKINELLLAGVSLGLYRFCGHSRLKIDIESHGREEFTDKLDLTQTLGWFTSVYPQPLRLNNPASIADIICDVKEQYRETPNNGIGFGVLKYLSHGEQTEEVAVSEIAFNYLGQFNQVFDSTTAFSLAQESTGEEMSSLRKLAYPLTLNGIVSSGCLAFELLYDSARYNAESMQVLMDNIKQALSEIVEHCADHEAVRVTPSDFSLVDMGQAELDELHERYQIHDLYPATGMQQGLLFHSLLNRGSYVTQTIFSIENLQIDAFESAWNKVVQNHDIFRTLFIGIDTEQPLQLVQGFAQLPWEIIDLRTLSAVKQAAKRAEILAEDKGKGFEFDVAPLMRMTVLLLNDNVYQCLWSHHHALTDGWCMPIIFGEVVERYGAIVMDTRAKLKSALPYKCFIEWLTQQDLQKGIDFWQEQLLNVEGATPLPLAGKYDNSGVIHRTITLNKVQTQSVVELAKLTGTTVNVVLQSAWAILLSRFSSSDKVVFGATTSGRPPELAGVENMIGLFINTLPVVVDVPRELSVESWLQEIHKKQIVREAFSYIPLAEIQNSANRTEELFDSLVVFENYPSDKAIKESALNANLKVTDLETFEGTNFDFCLTAELSDVLNVRIDATAQKFSQDDVMQISGYLTEVLTNLSSNPYAQVGDIELISRVQFNQLRGLLKNTQPDRSSTGFIDHLFTQQVAKTPNSLAVIDNDSSVTYQQLNEQVNQYAHYLIEQGVKSDQLVGVCLNRGIPLVVSLLAIFKVGAAYVPLDLSYPESRIQFILEDSQCQFLITETALKSRFTAAKSISVIDIDASDFQIAVKAYATIEPCSTSQRSERDLAYIIYTSGSTGMPKGVMIEHRNATTMLQWSRLYFSPQELYRVLVSTSVNFDLSIFEMFAPLSSGGCGVIVDSILSLLDPSPRTEQVTLINTVPSGIEALLEAGVIPSSVKTINLAGEALKRSLVGRLQDSLSIDRVVNLYGPSEDTTYTTAVSMTDKLTDEPSIGKPISGTELYILDQYKRDVPIGAVGELCISGKGLARGYLNKPELTASKFIQNPYHPEQRLYCTGDLVRCLPDGQLVYLGRIDDQVKIRGYRIELGEIEYHLNKCDGVSSGIVIARDDLGRDQKLVCYIIRQEGTAGEQVLINQIKQYLHTQLSHYMVPTAFVFVQSWPLTTNGKIDKLSLKSLAINATTDMLVAAQTPEEQVLVEIWSDLLALNADEISIHHNFFELGGHSLLAVRLVGQISKLLNITLSVQEIYEHGELKSLAEYIAVAIYNRESNFVNKNEPSIKEGWI